MYCHLHRGDWSFHPMNKKKFSHLKLQKHRSFPQSLQTSCHHRFLWPLDFHFGPSTKWTLTIPVWEKSWWQQTSTNIIACVWSASACLKESVVAFKYFQFSTKDGFTELGKVHVTSAQPFYNLTMGLERSTCLLSSLSTISPWLPSELLMPVWLNTNCYGSLRVEHWPLSFLHSFFLHKTNAVIIWCVLLRKFLKPLNTSAPPSLRPVVMFTLLAGVYVCSFPDFSIAGAVERHITYFISLKTYQLPIRLPLVLLRKMVATSSFQGSWKRLSWMRLKGERGGVHFSSLRIWGRGSLTADPLGVK